MATIPTPEETARKILRVFVHHFVRRPGHALDAANLRVCQQYGIHIDDQPVGMNWAIEQGWIERTERGSYRLTEAGFAEAPER